MTETTLEWYEFNDHLQDLCHDLLENQQMYADCILKAEGKEILCHRSILSTSSDFFKKIFASFTYESILPEILIPDVSFNCLQSLIYFIYNGEILSSCKDLNDLWDAATLLDIKGMKTILDSFFAQNPMTLDDTLDALVQNFHDNDTNAGHTSSMDSEMDKSNVEDIQLDLIDALIPIVPVSMVNLQNSKTEEITVQRSEVKEHGHVNEKPQKPPKKSTNRTVNIKSGSIEKRPLPKLSILREKALEYQKHLELAIVSCKKGMSLEAVCKLYPDITKETLYRNIKNFKLPHITSPE
uniref:CSON012085 protein n=1 Tax=Culicoides sonorensis TaxID=179676 RepID=A0A336KNA9_CULSO